MAESASVAAAQSRVEFTGNERFELLGRLGRGGMGSVYLAFDREQKTRVALKVLSNINPEGILLFKNEFRALQDLQHTNLVQLGELFEDHGRWFFTMELVSGTDIISYVRQSPAEPAEHTEGGLTSDLGMGPDSSTPPTNPAVSDDTDREDAELADDDTTDPTVGILQTPALSTEPETQLSPAASLLESAPQLIPLVPRGFHEVRLRSALGQLGLGLSALHAAHKIHRDLKPQNIMVTPEGRVVILDFGIIYDASQSARWGGYRTMGTVAYMAPEQAQDIPVTTAADWYSVGVILYQALTGRIPFSGMPQEVVQRKLHWSPPPPSSLVTDLPKDLDQLCVKLLSIEPRNRSSEAEFFQVLNVDAASEKDARVLPTDQFIGRQRELQELAQAYQEVRAGRSIVVLIHGESGIGKSFLVRNFLEQIAARNPKPVIISGRCYEREAVPYKAVDSLVDQLSSYLLQLPSAEARLLIPDNIGLLAQVFPVLTALVDLLPAQSALAQPLEPLHLRNHAFAAMRELLLRLARQVPLILVIDDLQWTDADSAMLLSEVLRPPGAPPLLLVGTVRTTSTSPHPMQEGAILSSLPGEIRQLNIEKLAVSDARELAIQLLGENASPADIVSVERIVAESQGHPLFIHELTHQRRIAGAEAAPLRLDDAIWARVGRLDSQARHILELIAIAGVPIPQDTAARGATVDVGEFVTVVAKLRAAHLIRTAGPRPQDTIEPYHDRVRESLIAHLEPSSRKIWHGRLALALEASEQADPELLLTHWQGAGELSRAAGYALRAAEKAASALAFDRAAQLYKTALSIDAKTGEERRTLLIKLGEALSNAGHSAEAADVFMDAAKSAELRQGTALRRRAAEQYLRSGHLDRGNEVLQDVFDTLEISYPKTQGQRLLMLLLRRTQLRVHGLTFKERSEVDIPADELDRIDACWTAGRGLSFTDVVGGAEFQSRHLLWALKAGEPMRIARGLALEAQGLAAAGGREWQRILRTLKAARELANRLESPYLTGLAELAEGVANFYTGRWLAARQHIEQARTILEERCTGVSTELDQARALLLYAQFIMGDHSDHRGMWQFLEEAQRRGDLYLTTMMGTSVVPLYYLLQDDPERAKQEVNESLRRWSRQGFHIQHYYAMSRMIDIALYEGDWKLANDRIQEFISHPGVKSITGYAQSPALITYDMLCRCCLVVEASSERKAALKTVEKTIPKIERENMDWSNPIAKLMRGGLAAAHGNNAEAVMHLTTAVQGFQSSHMMMYAAIAARRKGQILGGAEGKAQIAAADTDLRARGVKNPERYSNILAPGFPNR